MQEDATAYTIDPRHLSTKDYPLPNASTYQTSSTLYNDWDEDLAITGGQINFGVEDGTGGWGTLNDHEDAIDHLDLTDGSDFSNVQSGNAPARAWADGGFQGDSAVGQDSSPLLAGDNEPWNPMKRQFAFSISGPEHISSWDHQIAANSQWPSNLLVQDSPQTVTNTSGPRLRPTSAYVETTQYGPHLARSTHAHAPFLKSQRNTSYPTQRLSYQQLRQRDSDWPQQGGPMSSRSSTTSSIPFPDLEQQTSPSQSLSSQATFKRYSNNQSRAGAESKVGWNTDPIGMQITDMYLEPTVESGQGWQHDDPDLLTPYGQPGQQQLSLYSVGNQFPDLKQADYGASPDSTQRLHVGQCANEQLGSSLNAPTAGRQYKDECRGLDHPNAIRIPASSHRCQSDRPSSFPITASFLATDISHSPASRPNQPIQKARRRRDTISTPNNLSQPMRRTSSNKSNRASRSNSLNMIREDGRKPSSLSPYGSLKGRRIGPLSEESRSDARQKRTEKSVCIRCHMMKQKCEGENPCEGCRKNSHAKSWAHPCIKSHFLDLIERETCNAILQRCVSHQTLDQRRRDTINFSSDFDIKEMLTRLEAYQFRFNIRVCPWTGSAYTLNLAQCFEVLSRFLEPTRLETYELHNFVDGNIVTTSEWLDCVKDYNESLTLLDRFIKWNDMPCRNSYYMVALDIAGSARLFDVENAEDREHIVFAVQLCRIILRALELEALAGLQKAINDLPKQKDDAAIRQLSEQLGQLLLSLRWRIARWTASGGWSEDQEAFDRRYTDRVTEITRKLYCYYFITRKRSSAVNGSSANPNQSGDSYSRSSLGELPNDDSPMGFSTWMQRGQAHLYQARVSQHLAGFGS